MIENIAVSSLLPTILELKYLVLSILGIPRIFLDLEGSDSRTQSLLHDRFHHWEFQIVEIQTSKDQEALACSFLESSCSGSLSKESCYEYFQYSVRSLRKSNQTTKLVHIELGKQAS